MRGFIKQILWPVTNKAVTGWFVDGCGDIAAALAYFALFSLFPLALVVLAIFSYLVGPTSVPYRQILQVASEALPAAAYDIVEQTLQSLNANSTNAGIVGFVILLFTAAGFFSALDRAFDRIWKPAPDASPTNVAGQIGSIVWQQALAIALVFGCVGLLLVSLIVNLAVGVLSGLTANAVARYNLPQPDDTRFWHSVETGLLFLTLMLVLMLLYRALPPVRPPWRDVWPGALFVAIALIVLQWIATSSIITIGANFQSYGVIGGVMVLLLWIYLTSMIFLLGAEITYAYTTLPTEAAHVAT